MRRTMGTLFAFLVLALTGGFALASPATANHTGYEHPSASHTTEGCDVIMTFTNPTDWLYVFDYRIDGEEAQSSDDFGPLWRTVEVDGRQGVHEKSQRVHFPQGTGERKIEYRVARGAESDLYDPSKWWTAEVDCGKVTPAAPTAEDATCDESGAIVITHTKGVRYKLDGEHIGNGSNPKEPGTYEVTAHARPQYEFAEGADTKWTLTIGEATGCQTASPDPSDSGSPDPTEEPSQEPSETPSTTPSEEPSGTSSPSASQDGGVAGGDGGSNGSNSGGKLPVTGFSVPLAIGAGLALIGSGGALLLAVRRKLATL